MPDNAQPIKGRCLCGAVSYEVRGPLTEAHACHCDMCRRQSGHFVVATGCKRAQFVLTESRGLKWYRSSDWARRGFCSECGSALFWDGDGDGDEISINAGNLDQPTGLTIEKHIFVADKADYYEIDDDLPKFADYQTPMPES